VLDVRYRALDPRSAVIALHRSDSRVLIRLKHRFRYSPPSFPRIGILRVEISVLRYWARSGLAFASLMTLESSIDDDKIDTFDSPALRRLSIPFSHLFTSSVVFFFLALLCQSRRFAPRAFDFSY